MTAMQIELRKIGDITPYSGNPRKNDAAVRAVVESIRQFGFRQPIVVDADGVIICGHTRYKAAITLGLEHVPVHVAQDLTPEQIRAYRIADNKSAELSDWDYELLPIELSALQETNYDISTLGFNANELATLLDPMLRDGLTDSDNVPEPPDAPVTQRGDLWLLGDHRLLCGDAAKSEDVDRLIGGERIHLVNCDPPYNFCVEPSTNNAILAGHLSKSRREHRRGNRKKHFVPNTKKLRPKDRPLAGDFISDEAFEARLDAWIGNIARVLEPGRSVYLWGGYYHFRAYPLLFEKHGLHFSQAIVWDKKAPTFTRKDFLDVYEIAFYGWKAGAAHVFFGPHNVTNIWHVPKIHPSAMIHLTEKPVELAARTMQYSSRQGEHVLDLFGGSGSTLIAAEQTGRKAFLMEIDALYCDVIVRRWEQFTGRQAERIAVPLSEEVPA